MITKKNLLETIKKLKEAPIDYGDGPERIEKGIEDKLRDKETPFKDNPSFPEEEPDGLPSNWEELLASKRFKDVVQKVKRYTGFEGDVSSQASLMSLQQTLMGTLRSVMSF